MIKSLSVTLLIFILSALAMAVTPQTVEYNESEFQEGNQ